MVDSVKLPRVPTGIEGFDELCGGGVIRNRTYLVTGASGAGKTIFTLQYLYNGATKFGENGILLATEERPTSIRENALTFGWDLKKLEDENKLAIIDASSTKIGVPSLERFIDIRPFDIDQIIDQIIAIQEEIGAVRAVIDSSTSIAYNIPDIAKARIELLKLSTTLEVLEMTSLMTAEIIHGMDARGFGIESFLTEGTIALYNRRTDNVRLHSLEIYKMRGTPHSNKVHPFDITDHGLVVHPHEEVYGEF
ncbi:MAG: circadian clock protein KaiC [Euryarchaeota archaeon]|nr:circadian clock protein KaiC [Euryarchaeota archaeon]